VGISWALMFAVLWFGLINGEGWYVLFWFDWMYFVVAVDECGKRWLALGIQAVLMPFSRGPAVMALSLSPRHWMFPRHSVRHAL
jgi:hypothetical protein